MHDDLKKEKSDALRQQGEGIAQNVGGRAKEAWGAVTNDTSDRVEGQVDQLVGKAKEKIGEFRRDAADEVD
jgi:uncharacterized protein YjbJ (UPF0337 family)